MPGFFTGKPLASGLVATSLTAIYTVPASTVAYVRLIRFFNINAASQTLDVHIREDGTNDRHFWRFTLAQFIGDQITVPLVLGAADIIKATTTTASAVAYIVCGVEEL